MNHSIAENFIRSAKAPAISAGVMMAKVIWKVMYTDSGMVSPRCETETLPASFMNTIPFRKKRSKLPIMGPPLVNAML